MATPTFSPLPGEYVAPIDVVISCSTDGAELRYTLDGTEPSASSMLYDQPIHLTQSTTIRAKGFKADWISSETAVGEYQISVSNPDNPAVPVATGIQDVYPNPFSASATIKLGVKGANQSYNLKIYNIKGVCVYSISGVASGNFQHTWHGENKDGKKLPAGVYIISFNSAETQNTRKAVIK